MKKVLCCIFVCLLLCTTALAASSVTIEKYGVSFDVPEGMEWVETEDADEYVEGLKKILDEYSACGAVMKYGQGGLIVILSQGRAYSEYSFEGKKEEQILEYVETVFADDANTRGQLSFSIYDAGYGKWCKMSAKNGDGKTTGYCTVQGKIFMSLYADQISEEVTTAFIDSITFSKPTVWSKVKSFFQSCCKGTVKYSVSR